MSILVALWGTRKGRGRRFRCGWCDRRRWSRRHMIEARPWLLCSDCFDIFGGES